MLITECVWDNKQPRVSGSTIQLQRTYGGASVSNIS